jgi:hypothetical protein
MCERVGWTGKNNRHCQKKHNVARKEESYTNPKRERGDSLADVSD